MLIAIAGAVFQVEIVAGWRAARYPFTPTRLSSAGPDRQATTLSNQFADLLAQAGLRAKQTHCNYRSHGIGRGGRREVNALSFHSPRRTANHMVPRGRQPISRSAGKRSKTPSQHFLCFDFPTVKREGPKQRLPMKTLNELLVRLLRGAINLTGFARTLGGAIVLAAWTFVGGAIVVAIVVTLGILGWPIAMISFWHSITEAAKSPLMHIAESGACLVLAVLLYCIRASMLRSAFGLVEIIIGVVMCWAGLGASSGPLQSPPLTGTIAIVGGIYVIVRGIDNIMLGWEAFQAAFRAYPPDDPDG